MPYYPIDSYGIPPSGSPPSTFTKAASPTSDKYNRGIVQAGTGVVQTGTVKLGKQEIPMSKTKTVESLINTYKDKNTPAVGRRVAVFNLGQTKDPKVIPTLIDALRDEEFQVRLNAVSALGNFQDKRAIDALLIALSDDDENIRVRAASTLGKCQDERAIEALIDALKDEEFRVKMSVVSALGNFQDQRAIEGLITAFNDTDIRIRLNALSRLGNFQDQRAIEGLITALGDNNLTIRFKSIEALSKIGKPAVEPLIKALKNKETRFFAAKALGEIKDPRAITPLINLLNLNESGISSTAALALGNFKDKKAIDALVKALKEFKNLRYKLRAALINIGPPSVEHLIPLLNDKDYLVRIEVVKIFGQIKDIRAVKALIKAWDDEDFDVRVKAAESLVEIGTLAVEPLISLLQDEDSYLRWRAAWCLGMIKDLKSVKPLSATLKDKVAEVQWIAIDALGRIGDKKSVKHLVAFCKNKDAGLREKAESTIIKLRGQNICKTMK
jgi:HEAT repeat protein